MSKNAKGSIANLIDNYAEAKTNLTKVLTSDELQNDSYGNKALCAAENEMSVCFERLLKAKPQSLNDMIVKFQIFFAELESEAELTHYHHKALQCILNDLRAYKDQSK